MQLSRYSILFLDCAVKMISGTAVPAAERQTVSVAGNMFLHSHIILSADRTRTGCVSFGIQYHIFLPAFHNLPSFFNLSYKLIFSGMWKCLEKDPGSFVLFKQFLCIIV